MIIKELCNYLEEIAPLAYQESYDNAGLVVGDPKAEIKGVLICLDSTEAVVEEAIAKGCNLIIAHHPIVFRGLKRFNGNSYVERVVMQAIKNDIAIYAIHTNLDNVYHQGVNAKIAEKIGLENTQILSPKQVGNSNEVSEAANNGSLIGSGMIGDLPKSMAEKEFLKFLKRVMQVGCVKYTALLDRPIQKVAVCGGAGGFLLSAAIKKGADVFVTADYKYHEYFDADGKIIIADIGHYESEQFTIELLFEIISKKFSNFAVYCTKVNTNPVHYL